MNNEISQDSVQQDVVEIWSRAEIKSELKKYNILLKHALKTKPTYKSPEGEELTEEEKKRLTRVQNWANNFLILKHRISELENMRNVKRSIRGLSK